MVGPGASIVALQSDLANTQITVETILNAGLLLGIAYLMATAADLLLTRAADRLVRHRFRVALFIPVVKFLIYGTAVYFVFRFLFDLTQAQLVAFAGLFGAALGFGLKDLVADVFGGIVLVLEQPFQVGDKVSLGDHYGEVVNIGVRSTTLATPTDEVVVVPNFTLFDESIVNATTGDAEMLVVVEFYVSTEADVGRAIDVVEDALVTSPYVHVSDAKPATVVVEDDLNYRTLRGKAYVTDLRDEMAFKTDVSERVVETFTREGIASPKAGAG